MKIVNGQLFFKTPDVKAMTGLTDGQIYAARQRDALNPVQFSEGGDCYYEPEEVLQGHRQILEEKRLGSAKLRRTPKIPNKREYEKVLDRLDRYGYAVQDIRELKQRADGDGYKVMYRPSLIDPNTPKRDAKKINDEINRQEIERQERPSPDVLPFRFEVGSDEIPTEENPAEDFANVRGNCFGYADETNEECSENCTFFKRCALARFRIMEAVSAALDGGGDEAAIKEAEKAALASEVEEVEAAL